MRKIIILSVLLTSVFSCVNDKNENSKISDNPLYTKLDNTETGIDFINKVENEKDFNIFNYRNFYNGGGVSI